MIKQAVPPGGDLCIALGQVEACDLPKRGRLGCEIFGSGGLRSRIPRTLITKANVYLGTHFHVVHYNHGPYSAMNSFVLLILQ